MRDPKRIKEMLNFISLVWNKNPDLRLMQLLLNALGTFDMRLDSNRSFKIRDHYNTADDYVLNCLTEFYKQE